jgi:hypothetical protein
MFKALITGQGHGLGDMNHVWRGGHKVDIVRALVLQVQHHVGQFGNGDGMAQALLGNLKVLAEGAGQRAMGEKDGAGAVFPGNGGFLSKVEQVPGHDHVGSGAAGAGFAGLAVGSAGVAAQAAVG